MNGTHWGESCKPKHPMHMIPNSWSFRTGSDKLGNTSKLKQSGVIPTFCHYQEGISSFRWFDEAHFHHNSHNFAQQLYELHKVFQTGSILGTVQTHYSNAFFTGEPSKVQTLVRPDVKPFFSPPIQFYIRMYPSLARNLSEATFALMIELQMEHVVKLLRCWAAVAFPSSRLVSITKPGLGDLIN